jgi:hypothetical protein
MKKVLLLLVVLTGCTQKVKHGEYEFVFQHTGPIWRLTLNSDNTFQFKIYNDLEFWGPVTLGKWWSIGDTLFIQSYLKAFPKTIILDNIKEEKTSSNSISFDIIDSTYKSYNSWHELYDSLFINNEKYTMIADIPLPDGSNIKKSNYEHIDHSKTYLKINRRVDKVKSICFFKDNYKYSVPIKDSSANSFLVMLSKTEYKTLVTKGINMKFVIREDYLEETKHGIRLKRKSK